MSEKKETKRARPSNSERKTAACLHVCVCVCVQGTFAFSDSGTTLRFHARLSAWIGRSPPQCYVTRFTLLFSTGHVKLLLRQTSKGLAKNFRLRFVCSCLASNPGNKKPCPCCSSNERETRGLTRKRLALQPKRNAGTAFLCLAPFGDDENGDNNVTDDYRDSNDNRDNDGNNENDDDTDTTDSNLNHDQQ